MKPKNRPVMVKLSERDRSDLEQLAEIWQTTMAESIRRAVRETLERISIK